MAKFFKAKKSTSNTAKVVELDIEQYNHDGNGIGYLDGKICFVQGALPGERVKAQVTEDKAKIIKAKTIKLLNPLFERSEPTCLHYDLCGGCQLQGIDRQRQLDFKHQALESLFKRFAGQQSLPWQRPVMGNTWHYRRAARIGVWYERQKDQFIVGFRQRNSKVLTAIDECEVLSRHFNGIFAAFSDVLSHLDCGPFVTHLEVIAADNIHLVVVRHTKSMSNTDKQKLLQLGLENQWVIVSEGEKGKIEMLTDEALPELYYELPEYQTRLRFRIGDFIQVNPAINEKMVRQALAWLDVQKDDRILDLFCGIGNFSLPLARHCGEVVGVEGVDAMVEQASGNAELNQLDNAHFYQADLSADFSQEKPQWLEQSYNKVLLDPARAGAQAMMVPITQLRPEKILYVSCDPLTIARDSGILLDRGYQLKKICLMDMFTHTHHIEVMALFER